MVKDSAYWHSVKGEIRVTSNCIVHYYGGPEGHSEWKINVVHGNFHFIYRKIISYMKKNNLVHKPIISCIG